MKRENGHASAGLQTHGQMAQEGFEGGELVVHRDAEGLEGAPQGQLDFALGHVGPLLREGRAQEIAELRGRGDRLFLQGGGDEPGVRFVGVFFEEAQQLLLGDVAEELGGGFAAGGVHPHVERARGAVGEAARRVVELHGRNAKVGEDEVGAGDAFTVEEWTQPGEIAAVGGEGRGLETSGAQAFFGAREFQRVHVETQETSARRELLQDGAGVTAVAESGIDGDFAGPGRKDGENFRDHDGPVHASGRLAGGDNFGDVRAVATGVQLLVFMLELARMFPAVTHAAFVNSRRVGAGIFVSHSLP